MVYRCVAAGCSNTSSSSTTLHKFPKDPELRLEWVKQVLRNRTKWRATNYSYLYSDHFSEDCFEAEASLSAQFGIKRRRKLKPGAIPSIFPRQSQTQESTSRDSAKKRPSQDFDVRPLIVKKPKRSAVEKREHRQVIATAISVHSAFMLIHTIMFQLVLDALQTKHQTDTMAPPVPTGILLEVDMATSSQTPVSRAEDEVTPHVDTAIVDTMEPCDQITHTSTCSNK